MTQSIKKDVFIHIFTALSVYEWIDDPNEGPITIVDCDGYSFSKKSLEILQMKNRQIRNMYIDFDSKVVTLQYMKQASLHDYEIEF